MTTARPTSEDSAIRVGGQLPKAPSGIAGLDEITGGGLPRGRATLVCGGPGSGKTLSAMEFLVRGAVEYDEPGVFMAFEETEPELAANVASLGFDIRKLQREGKLVIDHVRVERSEIEETGDYDLEGLFVRIKLAIDTIGAKRVVLDTLESLFAGFSNEGILRAEIRHLFRFLKDQGQTVVITAEKGEGMRTRHGLEEYVSDCVIFLDHRVHEQISTRRLRIVKYRGTLHGTNEYPFLIDEDGISILPETSLGLRHRASEQRVSTGIPRLDEMLGGEGYYKGSTVLVSGTPGTGKTTLAASLVAAACQRGERCIYFEHEESPEQLIRNMRSVGIDLGPYHKSGALRISATRPMAYGLEMHLVEIHKMVKEYAPDIVVIDSVSSLITMGTGRETRSMLTRLIDYLKSYGITALTSLTTDERAQSVVGVSSLVDTWLQVQTVSQGGEHNRTLTIIKSRGMAHSNQAAEFILSKDGLHLRDPYLGPSGVVTGSARLAREAEEKAAATALANEIDRMHQQREHQKRLVEAQVAALRAQFAAEDAELVRAIEENARKLEQRKLDRQAMARSRKAFRTDDGTQTKARSER